MSAAVWPSFVLIHTANQRDAAVSESFTISSPSPNPTPVPEPTSLLLLGGGLATLVARRRSKTQKTQH